MKSLLDFHLEIQLRRVLARYERIFCFKVAKLPCNLADGFFHRSDIPVMSEHHFVWNLLKGCLEICTIVGDKFNEFYMRTYLFGWLRIQRWWDLVKTFTQNGALFRVIVWPDFATRKVILPAARANDREIVACFREISKSRFERFVLLIVYSFFRTSYK